jgi:hypothetical protein
LLLAACLIVIAVFHSSLRYTNRINVQAGAARIAQKKIAEIRAWARQKVGLQYNFDGDWAGQPDGSQAPDPDEPSFLVRLDHVQANLKSPCSQTEGVFGSNDRELRQSFRRLTVTVSWPPYSPSAQLSVTTLVGAPPRKLGGGGLRIASDAPSGPLPPNGRVELVAGLYDTDNQRIPDVMVNYAVLPWYGEGPAGNGIIDSNLSKRSGARAVYTNIYPGKPDWFPVKGKVIVRGYCRYRGKLHTDDTQPWVNDE